jgi:hypothetical protein
MSSIPHWRNTPQYVLPQVRMMTVESLQILILFFMIIIGKIALFEPRSSLGESARFVYQIRLPNFHFFELCNSHFFLQIKVVRLASNLQFGGPDTYGCMFSRNRVAQLYPEATGFTFRRLLRFEELRWRYSNPPPRRTILCNMS